MRLIIIDDVDCDDIADILGTRTERACVQAEEKYPLKSSIDAMVRTVAKINAQEKDKYVLSELVGKKIQIDDPIYGYVIGVVESVSGTGQTVVLKDDDKAYFVKYISGIIS